MKMEKSAIALFIIAIIMCACSSKDKRNSDAINLRQSTETLSESELKSQKISNELPTRPNTVLLTGSPDHRLVTVYKEKLSKDGKVKYVDGNYYHRSYSDHSYGDDNSWHYHYMPGLEAVYGYNMYNIALYDVAGKKSKYLFEDPVLVNTLYYPSLIQDTLYGQPVKRDYYLVSVYNEDTNNDSIINVNDMRRFYHFDLDASKKSPLIPLDYSVLSSEYDPTNDLMYIFAKHDENSNGMRDKDEPIHIFLLNLKSPKMAERMY